LILAVINALLPIFQAAVVVVGKAPEAVVDAYIPLTLDPAAESPHETPKPTPDRRGL